MRGDEGALAHVGEADQGHVGHQGQLEVVPLLVALLALLGEGRGPPAVGEEAGVAPAAAAALAGQPPVAGVDQVDQERPVGAPGPGADRDRHLEVGTPGPVLLLAAPVAAVAAPAVGMVAEAEQRGLVGGGHQPHVAAPAAVAPVGAAPVDVGLPPEGHRAGAAVARFHMELCLVDEAGHGPILPIERAPAPRASRRVQAGDEHRLAQPVHRVDHPERLGQCRRSCRSSARMRPGTPPWSRA